MMKNEGWSMQLALFESLSEFSLVGHQTCSLSWSPEITDWIQSLCVKTFTNNVDSDELMPTSP